LVRVEPADRRLDQALQQVHVVRREVRASPQERSELRDQLRLLLAGRPGDRTAILDDESLGRHVEPAHHLREGVDVRVLLLRQP